MQHAGRAGGTPEFIALVLAGILLVGAMGFGGGSRGVGDFIVHLLALPALVLGILRWRHTDATRLQRLFLYWLIATAAVIGLQLLPLPASVFAALPQRAGVLSDLRAVDAAPAWLPMTLDAWGTVRALLALATFVAMWLLASTLRPEARMRLVQLALLVAVPMALLGFAQAAAGAYSPLRPYAYHHTVGAIGVFANRNHFADLMAVLLPFAVALAFDAQRRLQSSVAMAWYALAVLLLLAAALSFSRAGIAVCALGMVLTVLALRPLAPPSAQPHRRHLLPLAALALGALAVATYAWQGIAARLAQDPLDDLRWQYLLHGWQAFLAYFPAGGGLGSFPVIYAPYEPLGAMLQVFALHAHNDWLEVLVEGGLPGALVLLAGLALLASAVIRSHDLRRRTAMIAVLPVALLLPLLHSLVDYPLRTLAIACMYGLLSSLLLAGPVSETHVSRPG